MKHSYPRTKLASLLLATCLALAAIALAVDPPPDGGYPNRNTAEGQDALFRLSTGTDNTALGFEALYVERAGSYNTAVGRDALYSSIIGGANTAVGYKALSLYKKNGNTAFGYQALQNDIVGEGNTAVGFDALSSAVGSSNTAVGASALTSNITGSGNTAVGSYALRVNTSGSENTATGENALGGAAGTGNTASGFAALYNNTGDFNTAIGHRAMELHIAGGNNTALGQEALRLNSANNNTALGFDALDNNWTGNDNIALGSEAASNLTAGDNNIDIGNKGVAEESNTIRIGSAETHTATYIAGISGATVAGGVGVIIDSTGHLGTIVSSERFKDQIKPMDKTSEAILALKPVTFHYKKELDPAGIPQFGLVAEQVEKVEPNLVARDDQGKPYTVRYEAVNAMLLNEFLKGHRKLEEQGSMIVEQQKQIHALTASLKEQALRIQKVKRPA